MEPDYKKMFEQLVSQIENEHMWACDVVSEYKKILEDREWTEQEHHMKIFYDGTVSEANSLLSTVKHIKEEYGLL